MRDKILGTLLAALIVFAVAGSVWVWTSAPCGLWSLSRIADTPSRCLKEMP